jgi:hypothetical protein
MDKIIGDVLSPLLFNLAPENFIAVLQCSELKILSKIVSAVYMNKITVDDLSPLLLNLAPENFIEALQCSELKILSKIVSNYIWTKLYEMFYHHCFSILLQKILSRHSNVLN